MLTQEDHDKKQGLALLASHPLLEETTDLKYTEKPGIELTENSSRFGRSAQSSLRQLAEHEDLDPATDSFNRHKPHLKIHQAVSSNCELPREKNDLENKYCDGNSSDGSMHNKMLVNSKANIIPVCYSIEKIKALQQRLEDKSLQISACSQEIAQLNKELATAKSETKSSQEEKRAIEQVLEKAHKQIEELSNNKALTKPEAVHRIIAEIEKMKVNEAERIIELKSTKRRLFNLENELSMEKQKCSIMKGELEAKQGSVSELTQKLCDLSAYARVKIHQLGSELAWHKHQKLEDTIGELPKVLKPSDETVKLRSQVNGLTNRLKIQDEHLILQRQSYKLLRQQFDKLQANFKHHNLAAVLENCRHELKLKGKKIKKLGRDLGTTLVENNKLRRQIALYAQSSSGKVNYYHDSYEREEDVISVGRSQAESVDSEHKHVDIGNPSSSTNNCYFPLSLDSSPPVSLEATPRHVPEAGNKTGFALSLDSSSTESQIWVAIN